MYNSVISDKSKKEKNPVCHLDCTLRDGGYYNAWDFDSGLITEYLKAMADLPVDMVEIGFRSLPGSSGKFKGGCAYCTDSYIDTLDVPNGLRLAVMINGDDLTNYAEGVSQAVDRLFGPAKSSPVELVRIATHVHNVDATLPAIIRLNELGYRTAMNLMQIAGLSREEVEKLAKACSAYPIDILYFADSLGSMVQDDINQTVAGLRTYWSGDLGFHAHNNMEWGVANCIKAIEQGVTWIDSTVLGMGRGPGNARTEYLAIELETRLGRKINHTPLLSLIAKYFMPMQQKFGWGPNPYYYMAGKYGVHPTYVQEMIGDARYEGEDILAVINHLKDTGGKHYSIDNLEIARNFYSGSPMGSWAPRKSFENRDVLLLGTGPGVKKYCTALESYIDKYHPLVIALNTQDLISSELINFRIACHPVRILVDCEAHARLSQPLITPYSQLPQNVQNALSGKDILDFGLNVQNDTFQFYGKYCITPTSLVMAYALAVAASGGAQRILLAGFDGYLGEDLRNNEVNIVLKKYRQAIGAVPLMAITPSRYDIECASIYGMLL